MTFLYAILIFAVLSFAWIAWEIRKPEEGLQKQKSPEEEK